MINCRQKTWQGFATIEARRGGLPPKIDLSTVQGQEAIRMICFRALEEVGEAYLSVDDAHHYEELIDAFNYIMGLFMLEGQAEDRLPGWLNEHCVSFAFNSKKHISLNQVGRFTVELGGKMGDFLRNRPWMNNSQSTYFDGDLFNLLETTIQDLFSLFPSFDLFYRYFMAKDGVLAFRLRSNY